MHMRAHTCTYAQVVRALSYPLRHRPLRQLDAWLHLESGRARYCPYLRLRFLAGTRMPTVMGPLSLRCKKEIRLPLPLPPLPPSLPVDSSPGFL